MPLSDYIEIEVSKIKGESGLCLSKLCYNLHLYIVTQSRKLNIDKNSIGLDFPCLTQSKADNTEYKTFTPGNILRIFSARIQLENLIQDPIFQQLIDSGVISSYGSVKAVPNGLATFAVVSRSRINDRSSNSFIEKSLTKLKSKDPQISQEELEDRRIFLTKARNKDCVFIKLRSSSTKQNFSLMIQRKIIIKDDFDYKNSEQTFSSYGLSKNGSFVPSF